MDSGFLEVLHADGPAADRAEKMALYGQFIGSWDTDIVTHEQNGVEHRGNGEIHFGWVLEGRAIQDVWMIPRRAERRPGSPVLPVAGNWYGTTLRVYDPGIDAWHILWTDPANQIYTQQIGRARGKDICRPARSCAGALRKSPPIRSTGSKSIQQMTVLPGGFRSRCSRDAQAEWWRGHRDDRTDWRMPLRCRAVPACRVSL
jgi:hypothetical protein